MKKTWAVRSCEKNLQLHRINLQTFDYPVGTSTKQNRKEGYELCLSVFGYGPSILDCYILVHYFPTLHQETNFSSLTTVQFYFSK